MSQLNDEYDDYSSIEGSQWTSELETTSTGTSGDGNAQGNESNSINVLLQANKVQLDKLKEIEEKAKPIFQAIQKKVDESAKQMATRNAEHVKRKQELEIGKELVLKSMEEKYQKGITELESENMQENVNFGKEMARLKEQLKEKINWNQVDLVMGKKLVSSTANPIGNRWRNSAKTKKSISISTNGLIATNNNNADRFESVYAIQGFIISVDFPGPVLYYFEVTNMESPYLEIIVGLSSGKIPADSFVGGVPNSYSIDGICGHCWLSGKSHQFEWPNGAIRPEWNGKGDVLGCGLALNSENEWSLFFTGNGILMGKPIQIDDPTANTLCPTISIYGNLSVEANFGDDSTKPFKCDLVKCAAEIFFE